MKTALSKLWHSNTQPTVPESVSLQRTSHRTPTTLSRNTDAIPRTATYIRRYDHGNYPVRTYNAQNGAEVRLIYGNRRFNLKLQLGYTNAEDTVAAAFLAHFDETKGTYKTFQFEPAARVACLLMVRDCRCPDPLRGVDWRYEQAPQITAVRPGVSTVTVSLIGVI